MAQKETKGAADQQVILISDDDDSAVSSTPIRQQRDEASRVTIKREYDDDYAYDDDIDSDELVERMIECSRSSDTKKKPAKRSTSTSSSGGDDGGKASSVDNKSIFRTPNRPPKKRRSYDSNDNSILKPITPSTAVNSSMNASLVFDMVTSLSTNDPGVAIATLRSIVVLGKEYPSNLLYDELIDRIQSVEAVAYADAVSIYASLVFVFDKTMACSCALSFPHQWEPLANALQDASVKPMNEEAWRRNLLVIQFYIYCFKQDLYACEEKYRNVDVNGKWIYRTRLFALLHNDGNGKSKVKSKVQNHLILQAVGCGLQLWKRVFDDRNDQDDQGRKDSESSNAHASSFVQLENEDACMAVLRLIEMLYLCSDQEENVLQRIQAGLMDVSRGTRIKFAQMLQSPDLKIRLATMMIGLSSKARSKENEWYECNAMGRVLQGMNSAPGQTVNMTDGYSWSHFDTFTNATPRNDLTRLYQEIARLQQN